MHIARYEETKLQRGGDHSEDTFQKPVQAFSRGLNMRYCSGISPIHDIHTSASPQTTNNIMISKTHLALFFAVISLAWAQQTNCSVKGYDTGKYPAFLTSNLTTAAACKGFCADTTYGKCASFAVGPICLLYNVTVNGNVNPIDTSPYTFYDAKCNV